MQKRWQRYGPVLGVALLAGGLALAVRRRRRRRPPTQSHGGGPVCRRPACWRSTPRR